MTLQEIKAAVESGQIVYWQNSAYRVIVDSLGQWFIRCDLNGSCIGLTWTDGTTMNGRPEQFYIPCGQCAGQGKIPASHP